MNRLTKRVDLYKRVPSFCEPPHLEEYSTKNKRLAINKLGHLEDIEEKLGIDLVSFLNEMNHLIKNSSQTTGYTTSGKKITTDYGYVEDFLKQLKEALE